MNGVKAILWDTSNGIESRVFSDPLSRCQDASGTRPAFSPDSKILALGCSPSVTLWDMETGSLLSSLWADTYRVIRFMADGKTVAIDSGLLDITTGELHKWGGEYKQSVACRSISPDGSVEVFSYMPLPDFSFDQPQLTMRDLQGKHPVRELGPRACPISFSPDGRLLASGSGPVSLWGVAP
jgi:WD40 repeat protein